MKFYLLTLLVFWLTLPAWAQFSVGGGGMTILGGTPVSSDGLMLTPSANLTLASNTLQRSTTALSGTPPSISRVYQFSTPILFSGQVGFSYLPSELTALNDYAESTLKLAYAPADNLALTVTTSSTVSTVNHSVASMLTNQPLQVVTAVPLKSDLTPLIYTRPTTVYGTSTVSVVVNVQELLSVSTSGRIIVRLTKDSRLGLLFDPTATQINGRAVQNSQWGYDGNNPNYHIFVSDGFLEAEGTRSFGLTGTLVPGGTSGVLTVSAVILEGSGPVETRSNNNIDSDKIEYFQQ